ncbi:MAG: MBL fold metallo-hydrolase [Candidatus Paceibacterota bacterium]
MIITYYGASFFKVQFSDTTLAFNPISKSSTHKQTKFGSDICFISNFHRDTAGEENAGLGNKQPFVIAGPGEYEVQGVFAKGFETVTEYGGEKRTNIVYSVTLEGMNLIFLGALSRSEIPAEVLEGLGEPDILFVPIGGEGTLSPNEAYKLSLKLEANIVIPMFYSEETLKQFQGEEGESDEKALDKLTIKKKEVDEREGDIVVLRSSA